MATIECPANVEVGPNGEALCVDGVGSPVAWVVVPEFDVSQLDTAAVAGAWAAGFSTMAIGLLIGKGFSAVLEFLRRA